ncbi:prolipoprotein diacylglyceryl transferase family protein [Bacillus horti]|uniref:Prolipoprotein diacylglyceryltransferase n=1 Tax=Caldalkalibacillus horti TaxID=77523 RepID=A0ABT9VXA1_9BACI|nr:prolipoprotein diacylglyceryl transferase family protein [Bacillus horti]MDQ0165240.1 prolipoprotein diacylglyceryltransferase [Bacillus horti]
MFSIPELLSVGGLAIPLRTLILLLIGLALLFPVKWLCNKVSFPYLEWRDVWTNAIIGYLIVWKFSFVLVEPLILFQNPSAILYATGGTIGMVLGVLTALGMLLYSLKKRNLPIARFFDVFTVWLTATLTLYWVVQRTYGLPTQMPWGIPLDEVIIINPSAENIVNYHPIFLYQFLLGTAILLYLLSLKDRFGSGVGTIHSLFLLGIGLLAISTAIYQPTSALLGLSSTQWIYLIISLLGLIGSILYNPKNLTN